MASCRAVLTALVLSAALSACGQKGPLYLPDAPDRPNQQAPSEDQAAPEQQNPNEVIDE